jgi:hypothetical protein
MANSEECQRQLILGKRSPTLQGGKVPHAKVSHILLMVGFTIPFSPFEHAVTRPKLNAM